MLHAIVMAGGSGTRFWPASRAALPKQLLPLAGDTTLLQDTVARLEGLVPPERTMIVTSARDSSWKTMVSSMRFRNSGRKCAFRASLTFSFIFS